MRGILWSIVPIFGLSALGLGQAPSPPTAPAFEVASVKPNTSNSNPSSQFGNYSEYESFARRYQGTPYTDYANLALGRLHESRKEIAIARKFFSTVTKRNEHASQKAAEALARLAWR